MVFYVGCAVTRWFAMSTLGMKSAPGADVACHGHMESLTQSCSLRQLGWTFPRTVGTHQCQLRCRFRGPPRQYTLRTRTRSHVRASPPSSHAWRLRSCPTRDRHLQCLPSRRSAMATTGAASVHAEVSPPFLDSCGTSRISTRALSWTSPLAPCSQQLNGSRALLLPVVASGAWHVDLTVVSLAWVSLARFPHLCGMALSVRSRP